jgi:hypothetical protein
MTVHKARVPGVDVFAQGRVLGGDFGYTDEGNYLDISHGIPTFVHHTRDRETGETPTKEGCGGYSSNVIAAASHQTP